MARASVDERIAAVQKERGRGCYNQNVLEVEIITKQCIVCGRSFDTIPLENANGTIVANQNRDTCQVCLFKN